MNRHFTPVRINDAFWRAWHKDKAGMKAKGYHVTRDVITGQWEAWRELKHE